MLCISYSNIKLKMIKKIYTEMYIYNKGSMKIRIVTKGYIRADEVIIFTNSKKKKKSFQWLSYQDRKVRSSCLKPTYEKNTSVVRHWWKPCSLWIQSYTCITIEKKNKCF